MKNETTSYEMMTNGTTNGIKNEIENETKDEMAIAMPTLIDETVCAETASAHSCPRLCAHSCYCGTSSLKTPFAQSE